MSLSPQDALPTAFVDKLTKIIPPQSLEAVFKSFSEPKNVGVRVNTLLSTVPEALDVFRKFSIPFSELDWYGDAVSVDPEFRARVMTTDGYKSHRLYLQNLSSMVPVLELAPAQGERVLDLTAAPGSKTLQLASAVGESGEVAAVEFVRNRFFKMKKNLEDHGADFVRTFLKDGRGVFRNRPSYFDRVLVDAPCSTEGRFSILEPESYSFWSPGKSSEMARKQKRLLESALKCVKIGGTVVYSTCAFAPEENEQVVQHVIKRYGSKVEVVPLTVPIQAYSAPLKSWGGKTFDDPVALCRRIVPDASFEAFFIAKFVKQEEIGDATVAQRR